MDNWAAMVCTHTATHIAILLTYHAGTFQFNTSESKVPHGILYNQGHRALHLHLSGEKSSCNHNDKGSLHSTEWAPTPS